MDIQYFGFSKGYVVISTKSVFLIELYVLIEMCS